MSRTSVAGWLVAGLVLAGCGQEGATPRAGDAAPGTAAAPGTPAPAAAAATPKLEDVIEQDPRYIVGISFPPVARKYPGLARLLYRPVGSASLRMRPSSVKSRSRP